MDDGELICAFCDGSDDAFAQLVGRHGGLVWSAARRRLAGNEGLAEDVVQKTFILLALKAASLKRRKSISGWLYTTTVNLSREALRGELRRHMREMEAMLMNSRTDHLPQADWSEVVPVLEEGMLELGERDRTMILLRFFERKSYRELAIALGGTEEALKMRTSRALEKLRARLMSRGLTISASALGVTLSESAVLSAPSWILESAAKAGTTTKGASGLGGLATKWMIMTTMQKSAVVVMVLLAALLSVNRLNGPGPLGRKTIGSGGGVTAKTTVPQDAAVQSGARSAQLAEVRLARLMANLRAAIVEEPANRRLPLEQLREAISDFGSERGAALPVILEFLNAPRADRSLSSFVSAAYCLELLGTDASRAIPDVMNLLRSGDLALVNDAMPRLFLALSPDGALAANLIEVLKKPTNGVHWVNQSIVELAKKNPQRAEQSRQALREVLKSERFGVRLNAAMVLAWMPGEKANEALPVLLEALKTQPNPPVGVIEIGSSSEATMIDPFFENLRRLQAVQALAEMGPAALEAVPALTVLAEATAPDDKMPLREAALVAIGKIDETSRQESPEIAAELSRQEREKDLMTKARNGTATFEENLEGLRSRNTATFAAQDLARFPEAREAIPALEESIDRFENSVAAELLKELAPEVLAGRVRDRKLAGINDVAQALGDLGPSMFQTVPDLRNILDQTRPEEGARAQTLAEALRKIDPSQPKLLFSFDDLSEPANEFIRIVNEKHKGQSPAYGAYIRDFQDRNTVSRGHLRRFVEGIKSDPELHRVFVDKLVEQHPELRAEIGP